MVLWVKNTPQNPEIYIKLTVQTTKCTIREAWSLLSRPTSHSKVYLKARPVIDLHTYSIQHLVMQQNLAKYLNIFSTSGGGVTHKPLMYHVEVKFKPRYTQYLQTFQPCPVSDWKEGKFPLVIIRKCQFLFSVFDLEIQEMLLSSQIKIIFLCTPIIPHYSNFTHTWNTFTTTCWSESVTKSCAKREFWLW